MWPGKELGRRQKLSVWDEQLSMLIWIVGGVHWAQGWWILEQTGRLADGQQWISSSIGFLNTNIRTLRRAVTDPIFVSFPNSYVETLTPVMVFRDGALGRKLSHESVAFMMGLVPSQKRHKRACLSALHQVKMQGCCRLQTRNRPSPRTLCGFQNCEKQESAA